jgi:hypothetical protein
VNEAAGQSWIAGSVVLGWLVARIACPITPSEPIDQLEREPLARSWPAASRSKASATARRTIWAGGEQLCLGYSAAGGLECTDWNRRSG